MDTRIIVFTLSFLPAALTTKVVTDGHWSAWTNVTLCSTTCGDGYIIRTRTCDNPPPVNGGNNCSGQSTDKIPCDEGICPSVDGNWGQWGNLSACSKTCSNGTVTRNRSCDSPAPENGGLVCNGSYRERLTCNEGACPTINGSWGAWLNYSDCSVSCGGGTQFRQRHCDSPYPQYGGLDCEGTSIVSRLCNEDDCPGMDNRGKEFILGFMPNLGGANVQLFITTDNDKDVNVKITTPLFNPLFSKSVISRKGTVKKIDMDVSIIGTSGLENKGIHITADDDIIVYAINKATASTDAYLALPTDTLGQEYYVVSWSSRSTFMIIGTDDTTKINIKLGNKSPSIVVDGNPYGSGSSFDFQLKKYQTITVTSYYSGDFTGTHIFADTFVTVLGGNLCTRVGAGACDHLVQQMLPIEKWGKDFVTIGMPDCSSPDTYRIVASQHNTLVNISGQIPIRLTESGDFHTFNLQDQTSNTVSSDKPISLALFANGGCRGYLGDPAMILIPPIQQFSSDYTFSTITVDGKDLINSLALVIAETYISGLLLDGQKLPTTKWYAVEGRHDIKYTELRISSGAHSVYHVDKSVTFLAISTGIEEYNSYGYPAGLNFKSTTMNCSDDNAGTLTKNGGQVCDLGLDPCKDSYCLNNGTCVPIGWTGYKCSCPDHFSGQICEIDLCTPFPSDVVFVVDSSRSMGKEFFEMQKQFLINLTKSWIIDDSHFQIAIVSFSNNSNVEYNFEFLSNSTDLPKMISNLEYHGQVSQLHLGIKEAGNLLKSRDRKVYYTKVKKYLIVISDGLTSTPQDLKAVDINDLKTHVVALGEDVSHYYLSRITKEMAEVYPPNSDRLWHQMLLDLIHPVCNVCNESNETDLLIAVDVSRDMDNTDLTTVIPSLMIKLLTYIGLDNVGLRLSLLNFADQVDVRFTKQTYSNDTKSHTIQRMSYFPRKMTKVSNFSDILGHVVNLSNDTDNEARFSTKKIILFISEFKFDIDEKSKDRISKLMSDSSEIFTIGLNLEEESFQNMLDISSSSFHVGTVGDMFANQIDTFMEAFVDQLSYVKCNVN
ncbi:uncharacterized protein LOC127721722 [Mytilus californianus]|uniref:uncharacterized protein LOC127721722 n=1 Tax=Mytilus californianus TaxID=6549 RepID=UPI0022482334|nr:uncharacterized protein LOC127721722 [Mytilus californianus]